MRGQRAITAAMLVFCAAVGVAIAGVPTRHHEPAIRLTQDTPIDGIANASATANGNTPEATVVTVAPAPTTTPPTSAPPSTAPTTTAARRTTTTLRRTPATTRPPQAPAPPPTTAKPPATTVAGSEQGVGATGLNPDGR